jgi:hypothetical protein
VNPVGSGQGPVAVSSKYGDEPSGSGATELVKQSSITLLWQSQKSSRELVSKSETGHHPFLTPP